MNQLQQLQTIRRLVKSLFNVETTEGQSEIVKGILDPNVKRLHIMTTTQYGKSMSIGHGATLLLGDYRKPTKVIIVAPTEVQTDIIMNYTLGNISSNPIFYEGLLNRPQGDKRTQFSKDRLAWRDGRELLTITASASSNANDINKGGKSLMGQGGDVIIVDEASLISDNIYSKILRMLGANPNSKLIVVGNPFNLNHFYRSSIDPSFKHILVDYRRAIEEHRLTIDFVEEMRRTMSPELFSILYEVKFIIGNSDSFVNMRNFEEGKKVLPIIDTRKEEDKPKDYRVGVDVAYYGEDESTIVVRDSYLHKIVTTRRFKKIDTMALVGAIIELQKEIGFLWEWVNIDYIGVGVGVVDRLRELGFDVSGVVVSESAEDETLYFNLRTELWGRMGEDIRAGLKIEDGELITQILAPKYEWRYRNSGTVKKLESKETMKKRGISSPDIADGLALSYYEGKSFVLEKLSYL